MSDERPPQSGSKGFLAALVIAGAFSFGIAILIRDSMAPPASVQVGREFPPIEALAWINPPVSGVQEYRGRVFVVDAWAYWCRPCRLATPMLLHLYEKYQDQHVMFLGLTSEGRDEDSIRQSLKFIESESIPWPNALGAIKTMEALAVEDIPQFWVVDRQNRIVAHFSQGWSPSLLEELERAVIQALNAPAGDVPK